RTSGNKRARAMSYYVYVLRCSDGSRYTGHTDDLELRIYSHQHGLIHGYTSSRRPIALAWSQEFSARDEAFARERQVKGWSRSKKEALIRGDWETLQALASAHG